MSIRSLRPRITIGNELKDFVPLEEVAYFVQRFRAQGECERAELQKIPRNPIDHESLATYFAVLQLKGAGSVRHQVFYVYANGNCPIQHDTPHLGYLFSVNADEVRRNLPFLEEGGTEHYHTSLVDSDPRQLSNTSNSLTLSSRIATASLLARLKDRLVRRPFLP
jgi:hypothetical protein